MSSKKNKSFIERLTGKALPPEESATVIYREPDAPQIFVKPEPTTVTFPTYYAWPSVDKREFTLIVRDGQEPEYKNRVYFKDAEFPDASYKYRYEWVKDLIGADLLNGTQVYRFTLTKSQVNLSVDS